MRGVVCVSDRYHPGEDADEVDMSDVLQEDDHAEEVLSGDFEIKGQTDGDGVDAIEDEHWAQCRWCRDDLDGHGEECSHLCADRREWLLSQTDHDAAVVEGQTHEFGAKTLFHEHGMSPYWAIVSQFDRCMAEEGETDDVGSFEAVGETWSLNHEEEKVKYWEGGIAAEGQDFDAFNEYQINVVAAGERDIGRKRINFRFRPSFPNMKHAETGDELQGVPSALPEGVRVEIDSANLDFDEILSVLQELAVALDINPEYFEYDCLHGYSRVYNTAVYVRLRREIAEDQLIPVDTGLIDRMADFGKRQGGRGHYKWDHEEIEGHRMAVSLDAPTRGKFGLESTVGALTKVYHPKHPRGEGNKDDPLYHPKVEIQFSSEYSDTGAIPLDSDLPEPTGSGHSSIDTDHEGPLPETYDFDALYQELDQWLVNCLYWAGVSIRADPHTYVADAYWTPTESERDIRLIEDPMPTMRERERRLAEYHVLQADVTPNQRDVLAVATDGGPKEIDEVANKAGVSERTVRRAADAFGAVLEVDQATVSAADGVIRDKVDQLLATMEDTAGWVQESIENTLSKRDHTIGEDSALAKWMRTYGVNLTDRGSETHISINVGHYNLVEIRKLLREGLRAARDTGHNVHDVLLDAAVSYYDEHGDRVHDEAAFAIQGNGIAIRGALLETIG